VLLRDILRLGTATNVLLGQSSRLG
jgi:hypothetical protein